jgi:predicted NUDIX family NTP pyrophosphohydrolase
VHAWAAAGSFDVTALHSNEFEIEWPPRSGKIVRFPEVDRAAWYGLEQARVKINAAQVPLLDRLAQRLHTGVELGAIVERSRGDGLK